MKNSVIISLITFSVVLLLALQGLWLTNSYEKAYFDIRREANSIFRNTVYQLRDTVFVNTLQPKIDSTQSGLFITRNAVELSGKEFSPPDSVMFRRRESSVQVYISSSDASDSLIKSLRPLTNKLQATQNGRQSFTIRIAPDSLNLDSLTTYFKKNIDPLSHNITAQVKEISVGDFRLGLGAVAPSSQLHWRTDYKEHEQHSLFLSDSLTLDPVRLNPHRRYIASLVGIRPIVLSEITPQILFSLTLTLTIIAAFVFMFRNIRSQQRLMVQKSDFMSNITHELKTPVATVSVALEALQNFDATTHPERTKEYLAIAQQELNRLTELTDTILKTTVFEEQDSVVDHEIVNLAETTSAACVSLKLLLDKVGATVTIEQLGENFKVKGSTRHLTNSISNLLENSIKYSAGKVDISIKLLSSQGYVSLSIKDAGIGIPQEYQKKIFEKFFRVPTGNIHKVKGYGLGLSYVANVVSAHKGKIEVKSNPDEGSEFTITLPLHSS